MTTVFDHEGQPLEVGDRVVGALRPDEFHKVRLRDPKNPEKLGPPCNEQTLIAIKALKGED